MRRHSLDLLLVNMITILGALLVIADVPSPTWRIPLTVPVVLFFPGYALVMALNPQGDLGFVEEIVGALGLSLALSALGGLLLHLSPWGLQGITWMLYLCVTIFGASLVAWLRRPFSEPPDRAWRLGLTAPQGLCLALALLVVGGAYALSTANAISTRGSAPTQFWFLPVASRGPEYLQVTVRNMEPQATTYRIDLDINGRASYQGVPITLSPSETTNLGVPLPQAPSGLERIEIKLYRLGERETIYRRLVYWRGG